MPRPYAAYDSRSASTTTCRLGWVFFEVSGRAASQRSVEPWSLCETAMKWTLGFAAAALRRLRNVFSATMCR